MSSDNEIVWSSDFFLWNTAFYQLAKFITSHDEGFIPFTPKFKNYILPTFLKRNISYEKPSSSYFLM